jgi:hypothetical protein
MNWPNLPTIVYKKCQILTTIRGLETLKWFIKNQPVVVAMQKDGAN